GGRPSPSACRARGATCGWLGTCFAARLPGAGVGAPGLRLRLASEDLSGVVGPDECCVVGQVNLVDGDGGADVDMAGIAQGQAVPMPAEPDAIAGCGFGDGAADRARDGLLVPDLGELEVAVEPVDKIGAAYDPAVGTEPREGDQPRCGQCGEDV